ncbi:serine hydrolase domain-containing protein [Microbulbifer sp. TRSA002]|uniref:serine hydrolase domain-containing protein n=1 Tax=Microbulbifer sp. TRSA002 TaxID=3243382 RepID=UPI004039C8F1
MKNWIIFMVVFLAFPAVAQDECRNNQIYRVDGTTLTGKDLCNEVSYLINKYNVSGLTITIFNKEKPVFSKAFGYSDLKRKIPLGIDTEVYGASLSKAVFSVLVMKLVDENILDLDKTLQSYLDEPLWRSPGKYWHQDFSDLRYDPRYRDITARMSLSHTTGLPNWRWLEVNDKLRLHSEPGKNYSYSGEGMVLLQAVIEKITGQTLEVLAKKYVFNPYGMKDSSYQWQTSFESNYALGHRSDGSAYPRDKDNMPRAPSTLETSTRDYTNFLKHVLSRQGLSDQSLTEMFSPQIRIRTKTQFGPGAREITSAYDSIQLSYGLGWGLFNTEYGWAAFKEGHGDGFQHYSIIYPDTGMGLLLISNSDNAENIFAQLIALTIAEYNVPFQWEGYKTLNNENS